MTAAGAAPADKARKDDTARELDAIQDRIRGLETEISQAAAAKPTAGKALREAELVEADARAALQALRRKLAEGRERERAIRADMARAENDLAAHRAALATQLRLAYSTGREEWLRVALTQQDPVALSRRVVYYGYITRQRSSLLQDVEQELGRLAAAAAELDSQLAELADLGDRQAARVRELAAARQVRAKSLETLERSLDARQAKLDRLREEARGLAKLMARLERESRASAARRTQPVPPPGPAQQTKDLPLKGRMVARFGQPRADGLLRWDGMVLEAPAGAEVRAVRGGRVAYADWLPGMGLLLVVDHGQGFMSLYGHNQDLLKAVGDSVAQGEVISRVGDSGGENQAGLYFEVRRNGKPVNPQDWVR
jgi:septal ring factor EnvC (AmiA/AmiB activator)